MRVVPYINHLMIEESPNEEIAVENICRYYAIKRVFGEVTYDRSWDGKDVILSPLNNRQVLLTNAADPLFPDMFQFRRASNSVGWLPSDLLKRDVVTINLEQLIDEIPSRVESGFFFKLNTYSKFHSIVKPNELSDSESMNNYIVDIGENLMNYDDMPIILLQDFCDIQFEYRFFIYNDKIICGSGCVECLNPTFNYNKDRFFNQVVRYRGKNNITTLSEFEINEYLKFAEEAKRQIKLVSGLTEYSMDVARINGQVGLVEINPLNNSGLFGIYIDYLYEEIKHKFEG